MPIHELYASFALTCLAIELTPGPNMTYLAVLSAMHGRKAGFAAILGIGVGLMLIGIAAALGAAAILSQSPALYDALRWLGVGYMLWLAYDCWRANPTSASPDRYAQARYFTRGLITNLLNPKAALFYIAVVPTFTNPKLALLPQSFTLIGIYVSIATAIHIAIVLLGARAKPYLENERIATHTRYVFTALMLLIAAWFAFSTRS